MAAIAKLPVPPSHPEADTEPETEGAPDIEECHVLPSFDGTLQQAREYVWIEASCRDEVVPFFCSRTAYEGWKKRDARTEFEEFAPQDITEREFQAMRKSMLPGEFLIHLPRVVLSVDVTIQEEDKDFMGLLRQARRTIPV